MQNLHLLRDLKKKTKGNTRSDDLKTHHMYSAMIFSVVSERFRLMRSVRRDMVTGARERDREEREREK